MTQHETHIAVVLLAGDRAYKIKKPVDMGFLDFSTRAKRLAACQREVDLNSRFAPDVYLGVADVVGPDGQPCDHLVVMRRMPDERRLSALVRAGESLADTIRQLARMIAAFHSTARNDAEVAAEGGRDAIQARWQASFDQVRSTAQRLLGAGPVAEIELLAMVYLAGRESLFEARIAGKRIVDGHGDLLADDIFCLDDGPRVLDCLEFDDHLRWLDGLDDAAFLAMDLERLGAPPLADQFLRDYLEFASDRAPASLLHHYLAYRAFVRVKVACLRHDQGDETTATQAREYAEIAGRHLHAGRVRMVLVGGLPGTGKSTVSTGLGNAWGAMVLSADRVRKELAGMSAMDSAVDAYRSGIYTPEHTKQTYAELLNRAEIQLSQGESVVLDASWSDSAHRVLAAQVAGRTHSHLVEIRCDAPTAVATERLRTRAANPSDADASIAARMAADTDPWPEAVVLRTTRSVGETLADALDALD